MGRHKKTIDNDALLALRAQGMSLKEMSPELGASIATLSRRIAYLKHERGLLTRYRELQGLQLTQLQAKILEAITPEKIKDASFIDLVRAFDSLKRAELAIQGKSQVKVFGLLAHLEALDKLNEEDYM